MILKAKKSYSGTLHSAGKGQTFEVPDKLGRQMLSEGYPVEAEGKEAEGGDPGRPASRKRKAEGVKP